MRRNASLHYPYLASQFCSMIVREYIDDSDSELLSPSMLNRMCFISNLTTRQMPTSQMLDALAISDPYPKQTEALKANCRRLCSLYGIDSKFAMVLEFVVVVNLNAGLTAVLGNLECEGVNIDSCAVLAEQCDIPLSDLKNALALLVDQGLLQQSFEEWEPAKMTIARPILLRLGGALVQSKGDLLQTLLFEAPPATFDLSSFTQANTDLMQRYCQNAMAKGDSGISLLIHGEPGTGKTELVRSLAKACGCKLYEVRNLRFDAGQVDNEFGARHASNQRVKMLSTLQQMLAATPNTMLVIDECEDMFSSSDTSYSKDSMQRLLEQNQVPCIWITNYAAELETSFIRRFKLVVPMPAPEKADLRKIAEHAFKGMALPDDYIRKLCGIEHMTPALIQNAGHVARRVDAKRQEAERIIDEVVENSLSAASLWDGKPKYQQQLRFDPALLNIRGDPISKEHITQAIRQQDSIRVLLCGPPGTGKTAYAHYLAEQHDRPLKQIRCSDVLSKYVGESEQNVARIFEEAAAEQQILLLDEVDSLLTSRDRLRSQHELQLVNELLTQLESFEQPLFAATNYDTLLDRAVMRRFDFKLHCDYLTAEQVKTLYKRTLSVRTLSDDELSALSSLKQLTPGDFAILARRLKFCEANKTNQRDMAIGLLRDENQRKQPPQAIGFIK